jgi:hypothetical protein
MNDCARTGLLVGGAVVTFVLFPIGMAAGLPMMAVAGNEERTCMSERGYEYSDTPTL